MALTTSQEVVVSHAVGLHARPAAVFARTAATFSSTISIENLTKGTEPINAKSIMKLLSAGIQMDDRLRISAEGEDEQAAVETLCQLIRSNFAETE